MMKQFCIALGCLLLSWATTSSLAGAANKNVVLETSHGTIFIQLYDQKAPISAANFRKYVRDGFYDGLIFHRVIPDFMIQGGGFAPGMQQKNPTYAEIKNEATNRLKNKRGTLAMARTNEVDSASSQFFINVKDNAFLDHRGRSPSAFGYAVFGRVLKGMEVVDKIVSSPTTSSGPFRDVPIRDVVILRAYEE